MSKKKKIIIVIAIIVLLVLFFPIPRGTYEDGGTREYSALTYKIIKWHRLIGETNSDGSIEAVYYYNKTSIFWIPDKFKSLSELWKIDFEKGGFEKVLHSKNE